MGGGPQQHLQEQPEPLPQYLQAQQEEQQNQQRCINHELQQQLQEAQQQLAHVQAEVAELQQEHSRQQQRLAGVAGRVQQLRLGLRA
jgi:molecular chaperone GrpE (heat shock protein)